MALIRGSKAKLEYDLLMQIPAILVLLSGKEHIFTFANELFLKSVGRKRKIIGTPVGEIFPELKSQGLIELLDTVYATGNPYHGSEVLIRLDFNNDGVAKDHYFNFICQPTRDIYESVDGILIHATDVTSHIITRKKLEAVSLDHDKEKLRLEFGQRAGKIGTYEWDLITNKSYWTKEFETLYGYPHGGFKAGNIEAWIKMLHPDDREKTLQATEKAIEKGHTLNIEYRVLWPDKTVHYLSNRAQIIRDKKGKAVRMNGVNIDITERKIAENNLEFISEASKILSSSLDYKTTLANVAQLAVPRIADWCSVAIKNGEEIEELAVAHIDPKKVLWAKKLPRRYDTKSGIAKVLSTGKAQLYPVVTEQMLNNSKRGEDEIALLKKLKMRSVMLVPLLHKKKGIGVMTFVSAESNRTYTKNDLSVAREVANRMALAIENARLYTEATHVDEIQKKLAAIVESSDDAIIGKSLDGTITSWNRGAERLYGYTAQEVIGQPVSILVPAGRKNDFPKIMKMLHAGMKVEHYETKRQTKDGRILDVSITVSPIRNAKGKIVGASKVARDITQQKEYEATQRFLDDASTILGTSIDYETTLKSLGKLIIPYLADYCRIVVVDENKQIKEIVADHVDPTRIHLVKKLYDAYQKISATSGVDRLIENGNSELIHELTPDVLKIANPQILSLIKRLNLKSYMGVPMKIGDRVVGALTFSSVNNNRLYTTKDLKLAEELARRAALAIENSQLYASSQRAVALRDEFISIASHELKTPITSLKMYLQGIQKQIGNNGEGSQYIVKMNTQINRLTLLIEDLLNVSRFKSGTLVYDDEYFNIQELVEDVAENIQQASDRHIIKIKGAVTRKVWGDKYRIGQVITNLLSNAIKYSPDAKSVEIKIKEEEECAVITVKDFGIGIDKHHYNKLFERFYRVSDSKEITFPGLGLGLYISNEIVRRYNGSMHVISQKGKGSRFTFKIPYKNHSIS